MKDFIRSASRITISDVINSLNLLTLVKLILNPKNFLFVSGLINLLTRIQQVYQLTKLLYRFFTRRRITEKISLHKKG